MRLDRSCPKFTRWNICLLILKRKTAINVLLSFPMNTDCTGRITAAVYFPNGRAWKSSDKGKKRKNANVALKCSKVEETWKFSLQFR